MYQVKAKAQPLIKVLLEVNNFFSKKNLEAVLDSLKHLIVGHLKGPVINKLLFMLNPFVLVSVSP